MDINYAVYSFIALFIIVDPIVNVPIFVSILENFEAKNRKSMVQKAVVIAAVVLVVFTLLGNYIFQFLGIEMYSFRIAGGILLFIISLEMLFGRRTKTESSVEEEDEARVREDVTVTPMAVPLLTGPGAITTGIVLFNSAKTLTNEIILIADILLVFLVSYIILARSDYLFKILGRTGTRVVVRIMGLLLSAIAVQFVMTGIEEAVKQVGI
ncbi:MAG: MarC family protein [Euryarchaeota archaeon]|nr:MarC family protein [Euryarchaeota archaeon]